MARLRDATPKQQGDTFGDMMRAALLIGFFVFVLPVIIGLAGG